jgi:Tfp pilus assembly protein PilN
MITRFNYLHDAPPRFVEQLRPSRIPEQLRTPLAALGTTVIVIFLWWVIESMQIAQAQTELATEKARAIASRADLAQARVRRTHVQELVALDRRIRSIRRSGAVESSRLADIANHVPDHAWLTAITRADPGFEIDGDALGLDGLSRTLASLMSSSSVSTPTLVRAARDERGADRNVITFQMRAGRNGQ